MVPTIYAHALPGGAVVKEDFLRLAMGKCLSGQIYDTTFPERETQHLYAANLCYDFNHTKPSDTKTREAIIRKLFGKVGANVYVEPNLFCGFYTAHHPIDREQRNQGLEYAAPIIVGDDVWFGGNTVVVPGVTIGSNVVIGAGSVVTHDIPDGVVAVGNPCRVIRKITEADKKVWKKPSF